ncbi:DUF362 domain-containing protein [Porcincola sp. LCP21S3_C12]|jgi:uncharacterized protein (DUF362 family)|uniref:DUF362 domain-containing protein n=1 Tax=Porcincola sp. LCP21S3_C12 TaxID=3438798 RepID=UPI003F98A8E4
MRDHDIIVIYGKQIRNMAYEICMQAGLKDMILGKCASFEARIVLKPNLLGPVPASEGATTHPEIVEGVIRYLQEAGFRNLSVCEGSWVGDRTDDALLVCGYDTMLKRLGVPFVDLQKDKSRLVDCAGMNIRICEEPLSADFLINLPVMKGHCQTRMTCALKNMKGCIPNPEKRRFHQIGLFEPIGHLSAGLHQDFILTDSICSDLTFEDGGNPVVQNRIFAAADPVLNDAYCLQLMHLDETEVPYIRIAEQCGVGTADLSRASVRILTEKRGERGEACYYEKAECPPEGPAHNQTEAKTAGLIRVSELVHEVDSCSACYGRLVPVLRELEDEGVPVDRLRGICIGQGFRGKGGRLGIGSCTSGFEKSLPGCPPEEEKMKHWLRQLVEKLTDE